MYAKAGIKYSFAVHLRDTGTVSPIHSRRLHVLIPPIVWVPSAGRMDSTGRRGDCEHDQVARELYCETEMYALILSSAVLC